MLGSSRLTRSTCMTEESVTNHIIVSQLFYRGLREIQEEEKMSDSILQHFYQLRIESAIIG